MKITTVSLCALCGIFPLLFLPALPDTLWLVSLFALACSLTLFSGKGMQLAGLVLLFFLWGVFAAKQSLWAGNTLPVKNQDAIIELTATDNITTHAGRITHLAGHRLFPAVGIVLYGQYLPSEPCAGQRWAMTIRIRAVHGQLNDGDLTASATPWHSINRSQAVFCRQKSWTGNAVGEPDISHH